MGIVIKQSFWGTIVTYLGAVLGYVSSLVVFPLFLDVNQIGLIRLIQSNGSILIPLVTLGLPSAWLQQYPLFKHDLKETGRLLAFQLLLVFGFNAFIFLMLQVFHAEVSSFFAEKSSAYIQYIGISLVILTSQSLFSIFTSYYRSNYNIVIPGYFQEVQLRLVNILSIGLFGFGIIDFHVAANLVGINYASAMILSVLVMVLKYKIRLRLDLYKMDRDNIKNMLRSGGYFSILSISGNITMNLTFLVISRHLGLEANGILSTCLYIATVIEMPFRAAIQIASPFISEFFFRKDIVGLRKFYTQACINLLAIALLLFIGIITNLEDLFSVIPKGDVFQKGTLVVIIVGFSKVVAVGFGVTGEILAYSPFKRLNVKIATILTILTIALVFYLVPQFGMLGAAFSLALLTTSSAMVRFIFLYTKLDLNPLNNNHLKLLGLSALVFLLSWYTPISENAWLNLFIRSGTTLFLFVFLMVILKVSEELNFFLKSLWVKTFGSN